MKDVIRELLGRAAYEPWRHSYGGQPALYLSTWEDLPEARKETFCKEAECVVVAFAALLMPILSQILTEDEVAGLLRDVTKGNK